VSTRCLVADDHPALLSAVADYLATENVTLVATASDGLQAVALAERERPDVAVVDFRMPRLAGIELLTRLREVSPATRVVVYTAEADEALVRGALGAGAAGVLLKESPLADLGRALAAASAGSTYLDPAVSGFGVGREERAPVLTARECEVLSLLSRGLTHDEIGAELSISAETVRTHVRKASTRLGASTRTQAVATALRLGLIA
jgi:DNA-binding NarL/FixJ family response regulator